MVGIQIASAYCNVSAMKQSVGISISITITDVDVNLDAAPTIIKEIPTWLPFGMVTKVELEIDWVKCFP